MKDFKNYADDMKDKIGYNNEWKLEIDNRLVNFNTTSDYFKTPSDALDFLITFENDIALDPSVSEKAKELVEHAILEYREHLAEFLVTDEHSNKFSYGVSVRDMKDIMAEAYQVVAILAEEANRWDDPKVIKLLDNLSEQKMIHKDVLPFECKKESKPKI